MTREEASYRLEALLTMCDFRDAYGDAVDHTVYEEAVRLAIEALSAQKTGKWYEDEEYYGLCKCDQCYGLNWFHSPFCPICGSKMEGEE